jgi:hypothetical protein
VIPNNLYVYYKKVFFRTKYIIWSNLPNALWLFFAQFIKRSRERKYLEKRISFGKLNPEICFYVIRKRPPGNGLFANVNFVLSGIMKAKSLGLVPIVDMENYWMDEMNEIKKINNTNNSWCYFFKQISPYDLREVYKSKNVILSKGSRILEDSHWFLDKTHSYSTNIDLINLLRTVVNDYIKLNEYTLENFEKVKSELEFTPEDTLAVFFRGTAYKLQTAGNLPVATYNFILESIKDFCKEKSLNKIFIVTEDYDFYHFLLSELKDEVIIQNIRFDKKLTLEKWRNKKTNSDNSIRMGYENNLTYLIEILLISLCTNAIVSLSNATVFMLANRNYENKDTRILIGDRILKLP